MWPPGENPGTLEPSHPIASAASTYDDPPLAARSSAAAPRCAASTSSLNQGSQPTSFTDGWLSASSASAASDVAAPNRFRASAMSPLCNATPPALRSFRAVVNPSYALLPAHARSMPRITATIRIPRRIQGQRRFRRGGLERPCIERGRYPYARMLDRAEDFGGGAQRPSVLGWWRREGTVRRALIAIGLVVGTLTVFAPAS